MEHLAETMTDFLLQHKYITEEQTEWCRYMLVKNMMSIASLVLLLPLGTLIVGWGGVLFYTFVFRFLRERPGGYHAKTPHGCLLPVCDAVFIDADAGLSCFGVCRGICLPVDCAVRPRQPPGTAPERGRTESASAAHLHSAADCGRAYGGSFICPPRLGSLHGVRRFCSRAVAWNFIARLWCTIAL